MKPLHEQVLDKWEFLTDHSREGNPSYMPILANLPEYFAAIQIILERASEVVSNYAISLGKEEYYGIERDEWKIGHDGYNFTSASGIQFYARVHTGGRYESYFEEKYITLPWEVIEEYIKEPVATQLRLQSIRDENLRKERERKERVLAEDAEKRAQAIRINEINLLKSLKEKYGNIV